MGMRVTVCNANDETLKYLRNTLIDTVVCIYNHSVRSVYDRRVESRPSQQLSSYHEVRCVRNSADQDGDEQEMGMEPADL